MMETNLAASLKRMEAECLKHGRAVLSLTDFIAVVLYVGGITIIRCAAPETEGVATELDEPPTAKLLRRYLAECVKKMDIQPSIYPGETMHEAKVRLFDGLR